MMSETQEHADFKMQQEQQEGIWESKVTDWGGLKIYIDTTVD
jgi:hypothetical protein